MIRDVMTKEKVDFQMAIEMLRVLGVSRTSVPMCQRQDTARIAQRQTRPVSLK